MFTDYFKRIYSKILEISREIIGGVLSSIPKILRWFIHRSQLGSLLVSAKRILYNFVADWFFTFLYPVNLFLSIRGKNVKYANSVLHISYMVHIPYYTTRILRKQGIKADYLAAGGQSPWWDKYDYHFPAHWPPTPWGEFLFFWKVVSKYEIIHSHFGVILSQSGWELRWLKRMGRKIVLHYRGCEARDPDLNMRLHPEVNICQICDYNRSGCREGNVRVSRVSGYADLALVTTPDLQDFIKGAVHFPFFTPEIDYEKYKATPRQRSSGGEIKIVHATNHPGIEGTEQIRQVIDHLNARGYKVNFVFLRGVTPEEVLREFRDADLTIGKMKMGYYANAQIESMFLGVPAITCVRPEFMTPELENSGFIFTTLHDLEDTLEHFITHPDALAAKRAMARASVLRLHDNDQLGKDLVEIYANLLA